MRNERLRRIKGTVEIVALSIGLAGAAMMSFGGETHSEPMSEPVDLSVCDHEIVSPWGGIGDMTEFDARPHWVDGQCSSAGRECDLDKALSREAATCLAEHFVLGDGKAHRASFAYDRDLGVPVWNVADGPDPATYHLAVVDALSGRVIDAGRGEPAHR